MQINEDIRDKEIRVIDADGSQLGILSSAQAMKKASEQNLDLVKIAPQARPPVCRIMDYGKYRFEQSKRDKEARKKQKVIEVKEVRMSLTIDLHDLETKRKNAIKFLKAGDKVKVSIRFRGREMSHKELGKELLDRFCDGCKEWGTVDRPSKVEGRNMMVIMTPNSISNKTKKSKKEGE